MDPQNIVLMVAVFALSISVHESSHALVASRCGDQTGKLKGRISLNPMDHVDPFGTVLVPILCIAMGFPAFGWARPVPVNPSNLRHPRRDRALVSAAGPGSNLVLAIGSLLLCAILAPALSDRVMPLGEGLGKLLLLSVLINTLLCVFNLIPFPPLDGHGILEYFLSRRAVQWFRRNQNIIQIVLIAFIFLGPIGMFIYPFINLMLGIQVGLVHLFWGASTAQHISYLLSTAF